MFREYFKERENAYVYEEDFGFAILKRIDDFIYLQDMYIKPEFRRLGKAQSMLAAVERKAAKEGYKEMLTSCSPAANNSTYSAYIIIKAGFKLKACEKDIIWFSKQISMPNEA